MNPARPLLYGLGLCVGALGLAVFAGAIGAELLARHLHPPISSQPHPPG